MKPRNATIVAAAKRREAVLALLPRRAARVWACRPALCEALL